MIQLSSSPHIASKIKTRHVMWTVVLSLLPEAVYGVILFGIPALDLAFDALPPLFLFLAIIFMLSKKR